MTPDEYLEYPAMFVGIHPETGQIGLGLGEEGEPPGAVIWLCPCCGAVDLADELRAAAKTAARLHPQHVGPTPKARPPRRRR